MQMLGCSYKGFLDSGCRTWIPALYNWQVYMMVAVLFYGSMCR